MPANKRVFFPIRRPAIAPDGSAVFTVVHGVQSLNTTTNFNLEAVFELAQLTVYENVEGIPDIEATMNKVLDGSPLIYHLATQQASSATLVGRSNEQCTLSLSLFPDTEDFASGVSVTEVHMSGLFVSSLSYTFPVEGSFAEDVTLVGNNRVWANSTCVGAPAKGTYLDEIGGSDEPDGITGSGGVNRREDLIYLPGPNKVTDSNGQVDTIRATILPSEIFGISTSGTNNKDANGDFGAHVQTITVSSDFGREELFELGRRGTYHRFINFPVEVTCDIEVISVSGDQISASEDGCNAGVGCDAGSNLTDQTINVATCEGTKINLGKKNKLSSVSDTGGDAGGDNVTVTYSYTNNNDLTIRHDRDPNTALRPTGLA